LYSIYKAEGDVENALLYHEKFFEVRDSLVFAESNHQLQELEARYQVAAKDAMLVNQELEISQRTYQRNFYLTLASAFLALVAFLIYRHRQKEIIMNDHVALQKEQISNLKNQHQIVALDHLLQGQEEERRRIAQDLHDGLGGLLSTVQVLMQKIITQKQDHREHRPLLYQSNDMVSDACQEVRRIAHDMMPGALINIGLIAAVSDLIDTYSENTDINFHFEAPNEEFEISDQQSIGIYRIIQEILNNTIKYAQCSVFKLSILQDGDLLLIATEDNGVGFNLEDPLMTSGLGIRGIKGRVDHLGGNCILTTQPGKGVIYELQIPIVN
jgi:signal transduction histidine kinase